MNHCFFPRGKGRSLQNLRGDRETRENRRKTNGKTNKHQRKTRKASKETQKEQKKREKALDFGKSLQNQNSLQIKIVYKSK